MATPCRATWRASLPTRRRRPPPPPLPRLLVAAHAHDAQGSSRARTLWTSRTSHPSSRVQVYASRSHDPYLNLSAEHLLLQRSHPESTVLLLYANDPCVVVGRNQNPWVEADLGLLRRFPVVVGGGGGGGGVGEGEGETGSSTTTASTDSSRDDAAAAVALVRRRSGGGAVFHDRGNVNYSVICPSAAFDRDRHAEMVARALRRLGVASARVNARHDIVVSHGEDGSSGGGPAPPHQRQQEQVFKVSGSAYKLTRLRSLHHGTCLLSSPNLAGIGRLLRSPAEPFVKARGVESVRSPIRNLGLARDEFVGAVADEFARMYGPPDVELSIGGDPGGLDFDDDEIQRGYRELTSPEWIYKQTPQFLFSTHPSEEDPRARPPFPPGVPDDFRATITARHGQIQHAEISGVDGTSLEGLDLHQITDWRTLLRSRSNSACEEAGKWFNHLFGVDRA